jgi:predicted secreted protein
MAIVVVGIILLMVLILSPDNRTGVSAGLIGLGAAYAATYLFSGATSKFVESHSVLKEAKYLKPQHAPQPHRGSDEVAAHDGSYDQDRPW